MFTDKNKQVCPERHDTADIYAVVYEVDPSNFVPLNGDNVLSSDRIVMVARIDNPGEPAEWTHFEEPFRLMPGKQFDKQRMSNDGYAITVVCTSSGQGAILSKVQSDRHSMLMNCAYFGKSKQTASEPSSVSPAPLV